MTTDKKPKVRRRATLSAALLLALGGLALYLGARNRVQPAFYVALRHLQLPHGGAGLMGQHGERTITVTINP